MTPTAQLHVNGTVRFENIPAGNAVDVVSVAANGAAGRRAIQDPLGGAVEFVRTPTTGGFTWSVPAGVTRVRIIAVGGGGDGVDAFYNDASGGSGAYVEAVLQVTSPTTVLSIEVGDRNQATTVSLGGTTIVRAGGGEPGDSVNYRSTGKGGIAASTLSGALLLNGNEYMTTSTNDYYSPNQTVPPPKFVRNVTMKWHIVNTSSMYGATAAGTGGAGAVGNGGMRGAPGVVRLEW